MATYDFARLADIERIAGDRYDKVVRGMLLDLTRAIIRRSPVGDPDEWVAKNSDGVYVDYISERGYPEGYVGGTFKGNWQVTIGGPATGVLNVVDPNGASTIKQAQIDTQNAVGQVWYLTNNVPYAERLEYGWSTQAPNGMVRISLTELDQSIKQQIAQLPK